MRLYLVERGTSVWSKQDRIEGGMSLESCDDEKQRMQAVSHMLIEAMPQTVYAADVRPDMITARALADALHLSLVTDDRLRPLDMGVWTGLRRNEVEDRYGRLWRQWRARPDVIGAPEGETMLEAAERLVPFIERVRAKSQVAAVVLSRDMANILLTYVLKIGDNAAPWGAFSPTNGFMVLDLD